MSATYLCPECNHQSSIYTHPLSPGITKALIKFKRAVIAKGENSVHNQRDMDGTPNELTKNEYGNFTMLRYHALVAKDDNKGKGYWLLTSRGNQYLKGELAVPAHVQVLNNRVIGHDDNLITIREVMKGKVPYFEDIDTLDRNRQPLELRQVGLGL